MTNSAHRSALLDTHQVALHGCAVKCHLLTLVLGEEADPGIDEVAADVVVAEGGGDEQRRHQLLVLGLSTKEATHLMSL